MEDASDWLIRFGDSGIPENYWRPTAWTRHHAHWEPSTPIGSAISGR